MGGLLQGCWDCAFRVGLFVCVSSLGYRFVGLGRYEWVELWYFGEV